MLQYDFEWVVGATTKREQLLTYISMHTTKTHFLDNKFIVSITLYALEPQRGLPILLGK